MTNDQYRRHAHESKGESLTCRECNGRGRVDTARFTGRCPRCDGLGKTTVAAVPELLEACQAAVRSPHHPECPIAKGTDQTTITHDGCTCHVRVVRTAIAKATGEN